MWKSWKLRDVPSTFPTSAILSRVLYWSQIRNFWTMRRIQFCCIRRRHDKAIHQTFLGGWDWWNNRYIVSDQTLCIMPSQAVMRPRSCGLYSHSSKSGSKPGNRNNPVFFLASLAKSVRGCTKLLFFLELLHGSLEAWQPYK